MSIGLFTIISQSKTNNNAFTFENKANRMLKKYVSHDNFDNLYLEIRGDGTSQVE